jgi:hypothetical protein
MRSNETCSREQERNQEGTTSASAKMSVVALPAPISMISKSSVARSLAIGLLSKLPESSELKRLRSSADFGVFVGSETATHELRL